MAKSKTYRGKKLYSGQIPFNQEGRPMTYTYGNVGYAGYQRHTDIDWRVNAPFNAKMRVTDYFRGRSACRLVLEDADKNQYEMFMSDAVSMMGEADMLKGSISGEWAFVKKGANYGVRYFGPTNPAGIQVSDLDRWELMKPIK